jgi:hypothetical protein
VKTTPIWKGNLSVWRRECSWNTRCVCKIFKRLDGIVLSMREMRNEAQELKVGKLDEGTNGWPHPFVTGPPVQLSCDCADLGLRSHTALSFLNAAGSPPWSPVLILRLLITVQRAPNNQLEPSLPSDATSSLMRPRFAPTIVSTILPLLMKKNVGIASMLYSTVDSFAVRYTTPRADQVFFYVDFKEQDVRIFLGKGLYKRRTAAARPAPLREEVYHHLSCKMLTSRRRQAYFQRFRCSHQALP